MLPRGLLLLLLLAAAFPAHTAELSQPWHTQWIAAPDDPGTSAGVFHFRKTITLPARPVHFVVRVSADNRYRLQVNGVEVSSGPARGDLMHWRYETVDLAPWLKAGTNVIASTVWNWGQLRPGAQVTKRTAFLVQSDDPTAAAVDTPDGWKVGRDEGYGFAPVTGPDAGGYYAAAPGETVDGRRYPWGWEKPGFDDSGWTAAKPLTAATPRGSAPYGSAEDWQLVPRPIPLPDQRPIRFASLRRAEGVTVPRSFVSGRSALTIPAHSRASLLLDQGELTMGHPLLVASGGRDATATIVYAESLFDAAGLKGSRNEIEGKTIRGIRDRIIFDGGERRTFEALWLRTWRYVQINIETADQPLTINDISGIFTAYPFKENASFSSDARWIDGVWDMDWRVFRLSAFETFWDTPYYEQFQYVGDSRIESLIALTNTGDDRLMRNAIEQFDQSRSPEGLTQSRYPSSLPQYIPPFSLWWAAMVHDHWLWRDDHEFDRKFLPGVRGVLGWYEQHLDRNGLLGPMPWWNFLDWNPAFPDGVAPRAEDGHSVALSFQYSYVLRLAADLERSFGDPREVDRLLARSDRINAAARTLAWDGSRGLFADSLEKRSFSQQTNALAILAGAVPRSELAAVMDHVLAEKGLVQASYYFRFYVDEALRESGMADRYLERLDPWRDMIALGLTTTLETPEPSRSDSHAWSAHPNFHLLATVLGIRPASAGFRTVTITPALGSLKRASGKMAHPRGTIAVNFRRSGHSGLSGSVDLPTGISGTFVWNGTATPLVPGRNRIDRRSN